jgi:hypothetical protein
MECKEEHTVGQELSALGNSEKNCKYETKNATRKYIIKMITRKV